MKLLLFFISLSFFCGMSLAQEEKTWHLEKTYKEDLSDFTVDNLGNVYLLSTNGQLKKISSSGDSIGIFNDVKRYGKLYSMDATNSLKLLLYYRNFSTVLVLDRFLKVVNTIDLRKQQIFQAKAIATSYDNNIWVFDEQNSKLKKFDGETGKLMQETADLRIALDVAPNPEEIIDRDGFVYLNDPVNGIYVFDYYGTFRNRISYTGLKDLQVYNRTIMARDKDELITYSLGSFSERKFLLPVADEAIQHSFIAPSSLYLLQQDTLRRYILQ